MLDPSVEISTEFDAVVGADVEVVRWALRGAGGEVHHSGTVGHADIEGFLCDTALLDAHRFEPAVRRALEILRDFFFSAAGDRPSVYQDALRCISEAVGPNSAEEGPSAARLDLASKLARIELCATRRPSTTTSAVEQAWSMVNTRTALTSHPPALLDTSAVAISEAVAAAARHFVLAASNWCDMPSSGTLSTHSVARALCSGIVGVDTGCTLPFRGITEVRDLVPEGIPVEIIRAVDTEEWPRTCAEWGCAAGSVKRWVREAVGVRHRGFDVARWSEKVATAICAVGVLRKMWGFSEGEVDSLGGKLGGGCSEVRMDPRSGVYDVYGTKGLMSPVATACRALLWCIAVHVRDCDVSHGRVAAVSERGQSGDGAEGLYGRARISEAFVLDGGTAGECGEGTLFDQVQRVWRQCNNDEVTLKKALCSAFTAAALPQCLTEKESRKAGDPAADGRQIDIFASVVAWVKLSCSGGDINPLATPDGSVAPNAPVTAEVSRRPKRMRSSSGARGVSRARRRDASDSAPFPTSHAVLDDIPLPAAPLHPELKAALASRRIASPPRTPSTLRAPSRGRSATASTRRRRARRPRVAAPGVEASPPSVAAASPPSLVTSAIFTSAVQPAASSPEQPAPPPPSLPTPSSLLDGVVAASCEMVGWDLVRHALSLPSKPFASTSTSPSIDYASVAALCSEVECCAVVERGIRHASSVLNPSSWQLTCLRVALALAAGASITPPNGLTELRVPKRRQRRVREASLRSAPSREPSPCRVDPGSEAPQPPHPLATLDCSQSLRDEVIQQVVASALQHVLEITYGATAVVRSPLLHSLTLPGGPLYYPSQPAPRAPDCLMSGTNPTDALSEAVRYLNTAAAHRRRCVDALRQISHAFPEAGRAAMNLLRALMNVLGATILSYVAAIVSSTDEAVDLLLGSLGHADGPSWWDGAAVSIAGESIISAARVLDVGAVGSAVRRAALCLSSALAGADAGARSRAADSIAPTGTVGLTDHGGAWSSHLMSLCALLRGGRSAAHTSDSTGGASARTDYIKRSTALASRCRSAAVRLRVAVQQYLVLQRAAAACSEVVGVPPQRTMRIVTPAPTTVRVRHCDVCNEAAQAARLRTSRLCVHISDGRVQKTGATFAPSSPAQAAALTWSRRWLSPLSAVGVRLPPQGAAGSEGDEDQRSSLTSVLDAALAVAIHRVCADAADLGLDSDPWKSTDALLLSARRMCDAADAMSRGRRKLEGAERGLAVAVAQSISPTLIEDSPDVPHDESIQGAIAGVAREAVAALRGSSTVSGSHTLDHPLNPDGGSSSVEAANDASRQRSVLPSEFPAVLVEKLTTACVAFLGALAVDVAREVVEATVAATSAFNLKIQEATLDCGSDTHHNDVVALMRAKDQFRDAVAAAGSVCRTANAWALYLAEDRGEFSVWGRVAIAVGGNIQVSAETAWHSLTHYLDILKNLIDKLNGLSLLPLVHKAIAPPLRSAPSSPTASSSSPRRKTKDTFPPLPSPSILSPERVVKSITSLRPHIEGWQRQLCHKSSVWVADWSPDMSTVLVQLCGGGAHGGTIADAKGSPDALIKQPGGSLSVPHLPQLLWRASLSVATSLCSAVLMSPFENEQAAFDIAYGPHETPSVDIGRTLKASYDAAKGMVPCVRELAAVAVGASWRSTVPLNSGQDLSVLVDAAEEGRMGALAAVAGVTKRILKDAPMAVAGILDELRTVADASTSSPSATAASVKSPGKAVRRHTEASRQLRRQNTIAAALRRRGSLATDEGDSSESGEGSEMEVQMTARLHGSALLQAYEALLPPAAEALKVVSAAMNETNPSAWDTESAKVIVQMMSMRTLAYRLRSTAGAFDEGKLVAVEKHVRQSCASKGIGNVVGIAVAGGVLRRALRSAWAGLGVTVATSAPRGGKPLRRKAVAAALEASMTLRSVDETEVVPVHEAAWMLVRCCHNWLRAASVILSVGRGLRDAVATPVTHIDREPSLTPYIHVAPSLFSTSRDAYEGMWRLYSSVPPPPRLATSKTFIRTPPPQGKKASVPSARATNLPISDPFVESVDVSPSNGGFAPWPLATTVLEMRRAADRTARTGTRRGSGEVSVASLAPTFEHATSSHSVAGDSGVHDKARSRSGEPRSHRHHHHEQHRDDNRARSRSGPAGRPPQPPKAPDADAGQHGESAAATLARQSGGQRSRPDTPVMGSRPGRAEPPSRSPSQDPAASPPRATSSGSKARRPRSRSSTGRQATNSVAPKGEKAGERGTGHELDEFIQEVLKPYNKRSFDDFDLSYLDPHPLTMRKVLRSEATPTPEYADADWPCCAFEARQRRLELGDNRVPVPDFLLLEHPDGERRRVVGGGWDLPWRRSGLTSPCGDCGCRVDFSTHFRFLWQKGRTREGPPGFLAAQACAVVAAQIVYGDGLCSAEDVNEALEALTDPIPDSVEAVLSQPLEHWQQHFYSVRRVVNQWTAWIEDEGARHLVVQIPWMLVNVLENIRF